MNGQRHGRDILLETQVHNQNTHSHVVVEASLRELIVTALNAFSHQGGCRKHTTRSVCNAEQTVRPAQLEFDITMKLTMFYDSLCPLCVAEVQQLQALDKHSALQFVDIYGENFRDQWPHIDPVKADKILHAQRADGSMVYGLDVSAEAWALVGKHRWLKLLRLPVIRWISDLAYKVFARHRYTISYLLTGQRRCAVCERSTSSGVCKIEPVGTSRCDAS